MASENYRRVLFDTRSKHWNQNPYVSLLVESLSPDVKVLGFSWRAALLGRYSTVHLHWPEYLLKHPRLWQRVAARLLFTVWLLRILAFQTNVVSTRHNLERHVSVARIDELLLRGLESSVRIEIRLTHREVKSLSARRRVVHIPHGDYEPFLARHGYSADVVSTIKSARTRLLVFGIIRPYKNIEAVVSAVVSDATGQYDLLVAGRCADEHYGEQLSALAAKSPSSISWDRNRVDDTILIQYISQADFVVVPYEDLYSSGALLLALSVGTPVIVKDGAVASELQSEFGRSWVLTYGGELVLSKLDRLIADHTRPDQSVPDFSQRRWGDIGQAHKEIYRGGRIARDPRA